MHINQIMRLIHVHSESYTLKNIVAKLISPYSAFVQQLAARVMQAIPPNVQSFSLSLLLHVT